MLTLHQTIDGRPRPGSGYFETRSPYSGQVVAQVPEATQQDVEEAVGAAARALRQGPWGRSTTQERSDILSRLADLIEEHVDELARLEASDNGKGIREVRAQVAGTAGWYRHFASLIRAREGRLANSGKSNYLTMVEDVPVGVVAAILPWNSPLSLLSFKAAPALAAGCTMVVKPSEVAPASILRIMELFSQAGVPPGVINTVSGSRPEVGSWLVSDPRVDKVSFTGSEGVGRLVASAAGEALSAVALELGGKSANIIFSDTPVDHAVNGLVSGIFAAAGQTCIAGSRALVHESVYQEVVDALLERMRSIRLGDPLDPDTDMRPLASEAQFRKVEAFCAALNPQRVLAGGRASEFGGLFWEPTAVEITSSQEGLWQDEVFGPVLAIRRFADEAEAVSLANDSRYALAAGVWTNDLRRAIRVARALRAGTVWVNGYRNMSPGVPFGGFGDSGFGRENGSEGLDEFLTQKAVWIETEGSTRDPFQVG